MGLDVYENPHAERINGTIKNSYVIPWRPDTFKELQACVGRAVKNYNMDKPHNSLGRLTPYEYRILNEKVGVELKDKKTTIKTENDSLGNLPVLTAHHNYQNV